MNDFNVFSLLDVNVVGMLDDYDVPENVPEWSWIESNASFKNVHNGEYGVWEFMINLSLIEDDLSSVPEKLMPIISSALSNGYSYILFNQGS